MADICVGAPVNKLLRRSAGSFPTLPPGEAEQCISLIIKLLRGDGCPPSFLDEFQIGSPTCLTLRRFAAIFTSFLCGRTQAQLLVQDDAFTKDVEAILQKHTNPDVEKDGLPVIVTEALILEIAFHDILHTTHIPNLVAMVKAALEHSADMAKAISGRVPNSLDSLHRVYTFLATRNPLSIYRSGGVTPKEADTFVYTSSWGMHVQIGIPPETIKASMKQGKTPPQVYVLPPRLMKNDINLGEVEFPIFFNFFVKKAFMHPEHKVVIIGDEKTIERVKVLFQESVFGPTLENLHIDEDIAPRKAYDGYQIDFPRERSFLCFKDKTGKVPPLTAFADFVPFDAKGEASFKSKPNVAEDKEITVTVRNTRGVLQFLEDGKVCGAFDCSCMCSEVEETGAKTHCNVMPDEFPESALVFQPPVLGISFIGTSHGFDPKGRTTGFIIWVNGHGVLVDPPVQTTEFLRHSGIHRKSVCKVILTHCHSDHDSGLIRKILEGEKIELYTTKTINESYKRKMNAITGAKNFGEFYTFRQVKVGEPVNIHGATFDFDYAFHTIPCMRFKLSYKGKSIAYSADTYYSPEAYAELHRNGTFNAQREISLRQFLFDADMIIHEAGVPTIHTDIYDLNNLPASTKRKMWIVHTASIPPTIERTSADGQKTTIRVTDLKIPKTGVANTITLEVGAFCEGYAYASRLFRYFCNVFYFRNLTPPMLYDLFSRCEEVIFQAGDVIIKAGDEPRYFYILESGQVQVLGCREDDVPGMPPTLLATLVHGESFGEAALQLGPVVCRRQADVIAKTKCHLLSLASLHFRDVMKTENQPVGSRIDLSLDVAKVQRQRPFLRDILSKNFLFKSLHADQIEMLAAMAEEEKTFPPNSVVFKQGGLDGSLWVIKDGSVRLLKYLEETPETSVDFLRLGPGDCFGEMALVTGLPRTATALTSDTSVLLEIRRENFNYLMQQYQNIRYAVTSAVEARMVETQRVSEQIAKRAKSPHRTTDSGSGSTLSSLMVPPFPSPLPAGHHTTSSPNLTSSPPVTRNT